MPYLHLQDEGHRLKKYNCMLLHLHPLPAPAPLQDEGHRLKNSNCKLLQELRLIPASNKLLLSGGWGREQV